VIHDDCPTHKRHNSPLSTQPSFLSLHLEYSLSKSGVEGLKMTTAKWTSIPERSRIYGILLQDLMKRGACRCGMEMLLRRTPLTTLVPKYIDDSGQCHFNNVEWHICLKAHTVLKSRYLPLGILHTSFLPHFMRCVPTNAKDWRIYVNIPQIILIHHLYTSCK
jgi:hypothetical protein